MDRRAFLRTSAASLACFSLAGMAKPLQANGDQHSKPNVIFILCDDMGWGDPSCYGHPHIKTPNIDRLAREGRMFTNFYVNSPVCSPSRAGIMTGRYPSKMGIHGHFFDEENNKKRKMPQWLDPKILTLTKFMKENGYVTGHFGKWHLGGPWQEDAPKPQEYGIDEQITHVSSDQHLWDFISEDPRITVKPGEHMPCRFSEAITTASIDFIDKHKDEPFFLNVWHWMPHSPITPNEEQMKRYEPFKSPWPEYTTPAQVYYSAITDLDYHIGRMLNRVKEHGLEDNTIVIFTSDNGPEDLHIGNAAHSGFGSTGVFRGRKRSIYEGGIREPLIVKWPNSRIPKGTIDKETILIGTDFLASIAGMLGLKLPAKNDIDGKDMSAALLGTPVDRKGPIMWEYRFGVVGYEYHRPPRLAMREGDYKILIDPDGSRVELYNLKTDPGELDNLANEKPQLCKKMQAKLMAWHRSLPNNDFVDPSRKAKSGWERLLEDS